MTAEPRHNAKASVFGPGDGAVRSESPRPEYVKSGLPVGKSGEWRVEKVEIQSRPYDPKADMRPECFQFRPGRYTCLRHGHTIFMTDLYDEWWTQKAAMEQACARGGQVLITGLGLGLVAESILQTRGCPVERITILERSRDVIRLVGPYLRDRYGEQIRIVKGDVFSWRPARRNRFTVIWHDIWPNPHEEGVAAEIDRLAEHYKNFCDWQGFWPREYWAAESSSLQHSRG